MLTVTGLQKNGNAVIEIADDGVGMDEETLEHFFEKHKVNYRSNGVGVYNVQRRLSMYYGKEYGLSYKSEKGKGHHCYSSNSDRSEEHYESVNNGLCWFASHWQFVWSPGGCFTSVRKTTAKNGH